MRHVRMILACTVFFGTPCVAAPSEPATTGAPLPPWREGELDILHISTGSGNAAFLVLPDGTTMLIDAGDLDRTGFEGRAQPLKLSPRRPSAQETPGQVIARVIGQAMPAGQDPRIDFALVTHFHDDHYGGVRPGLATSKFGPYVLTGLADVAETVPIGTLFDRTYPDYSVPTDLVAHHGPSFQNYLAFQHAQRERRGMKVERLAAGRADQIVLLHHPARYRAFNIRNVKSGEYLWDGKGEGATRLFEPHEMLDAKGRFTENPLSLALVVSSGDFEYFTGGDNTGLAGPDTPSWFDVETPMASVVGEVDAMTLNHHGNRDATNFNFLSALQPRILVQQTWVSDHPGGEVLHRMASPNIWKGSRDIFSTSMAEETKVALGPPMMRAYTSFDGHVLIRVAPGGATYRVYVLDDTRTDMTVKSVYGPYSAR